MFFPSRGRSAIFCASITVARLALAGFQQVGRSVDSDLFRGRAKGELEIELLPVSDTEIDMLIDFGLKAGRGDGHRPASGIEKRKDIAAFIVRHGARIGIRRHAACGDLSTFHNRSLRIGTLRSP